jgi:serine protease Do
MIEARRPMLRARRALTQLLVAGSAFHCGAALAQAPTGSISGAAHSGTTSANAAPVTAASPVAAVAPTTINALETLEAAFTSIAESVSSAVVAIRIESRRRVGNPFGGFPFGDLFGLPERREQYQVQHGTGSGVVIRADGFILTNKHVVEGASRVDVVFRDGTRLLGKTVGVDDATDLAVVKVEKQQLTAATFADSNRAKPGQWAMAVGSPFGLDYSVTVGVLSAVGRGGMGANEIEDYLQTDASINPGNSGGPLVNLRGEVLGINTMIVGQGTGIGFAIPSNLARVVAEQLIADGSVHRAYIGVTFQELTPQLAEQFHLHAKGGALVSSVLPNSPAERVGLQAGDVIVGVDSQIVTEYRDLLRALLMRRVGASVVLAVVRDRKELKITLVTEERPNSSHVAHQQAGKIAVAPDQFGLELQPLSKLLSDRLGYAGLQGVLIASVQRGSTAERAGLKPNDLIIEADRKPINDAAGVKAALADGTALLRIRRGAEATYVVLSRE